MRGEGFQISDVRFQRSGIWDFRGDGGGGVGPALVDWGSGFAGLTFEISILGLGGACEIACAEGIAAPFPCVSATPSITMGLIVVYLCSELSRVIDLLYLSKRGNFGGASRFYLDRFG